ncbi:MAG TPA: Gfo/Idh/MocA family oxidoreductase [Terriglobales bacterium]|nr:Gfo/Idh/MocA family oxidoreductase [Terriglobales bacterium]
MKKSGLDRRDFIKGVATSAAVMSALPHEALAMGNGNVVYEQGPPAEEPKNVPTRIKFAVAGINHPHIYGMIAAVKRGGGEFASFYVKEPDLAAEFAKRFPDVKQARSEDEILQDKSIQLVLSSGIPIDRAPLGIRVMKAGKDYMADKPGIITLEQLAEVRKVQAQTKRIYSIAYSERFDNKATVRAGELVKAGAIGKVVQTIGMGPHSIGLNPRPAWFFEKSQYGGILCDIGSHQADQFLFFTGSTQADVVASQVGNLHYSEKYPNFEDFGDTMLRGNNGTGYIRLDWFTPKGLSTWGDGRLFILGTDGYIEVRKNNDITKAPGGSHLYLVDQKETRYIDTSNQVLPYGPQVVDDVVNRTETAMTQAHCFLAMELMLKAQKNAQKLTFKA